MSSRGTGIKTADICDRYASSVEVCEPIFEGYGAVAAFAGPISTVEVYEDNVLVREALEDLAAGTVLAVDGGGSRRCALIGDKLASIAASRGLEGIIVNGCVRDSGKWPGSRSASWLSRRAPSGATRCARAGETFPGASAA